MLSFVGLGLYDERSVTIRGRDVIAEADQVLTEFYTSQLPGTTLDSLEHLHGRPIEQLDRSQVEQDPKAILDPADHCHVAFLTGGDPMISTTHIDLRLRAADRGITTKIIHAPSASTAASGLSGLQNYRFGKATTIPFPDDRWETNIPPSVIETITDNRTRGLHTIAYLDIDGANDEFLTADEAAAALAGPMEDCLAVVVARAGSDEPLILANQLSALGEQDFGPPLHLLVIPGTLHPMERDALATFADAPDTVLPE